MEMERDLNPKIKTIKEGSAEILSNGRVFYNPVQEFNRDLSVAVLNVYAKQLKEERQQKNRNKLQSDNQSGNEDEYIRGIKYDNGLRILEALSATGLRSVRYAKEIAGIKEIYANDMSKDAVESIKNNIKHNNVEHLVVPSYSDALKVMYLSTAPEKRFDAVDLDPYGCPNAFLDGAIQCLTDGGILLVTATDMAVLAGNCSETCWVKYGSVALRSKACHEMALRILLRAVEGHANRYGKYIEPLLSISVNFYIRIFVRVYSSPHQCKFSLSKQSMVYQCTGCETMTFQPLGIVKPNPTPKNPNQVKFALPTGPAINTNCSHCGHKHHLGGPIWTAPIHNQAFVQELLTEIEKSELGTSRQLIGKLNVIAEELPDIPLYYSLDKLCSVVKLEIVPMLKMRSALLYAGYKVSFSHACKNSIKTNAPPSVLWDILRCWNKRYPVKPERMIEGTPLKAILDIQPAKEYNLFECHPEANPSSRKNALSRFPENPTPHWGPGTRATIMIGEDKLQKSYRNQNKKQHKSAANKDNDSMPASKHIKLE